jgi:NAD(P)-dependent dehydrogenase (short-subunit alcohol dehydrogenase family)
MNPGQLSVVVGGGSGIGAAVARVLAKRGLLLLAVRDIEAAEALVKQLGADVIAVKCDVSRRDEIAALAARVDQLGSLVITAAVSSRMASAETIYSVNLVGTARVLEAFESKVVPGSVAVCFASIAAHAMNPSERVLDAIDDPLSPDLPGRLTAAGVDVGDPLVAYGLSKLGVIRRVNRLSSAWGKQGGRILSVSPGIIDTPMSRVESEGVDPSLLQNVMDGWPVPRRGRPDEVAAVVDFLCSGDASYMTGSDVLVDGGSLGRTPGTSGSGPRLSAKCQ